MFEVGVMPSLKILFTSFEKSFLEPYLRKELLKGAIFEERFSIVVLL
jgi:hypothetical protein